MFTGIGGIDLAAEWAGFETVGQCEWADYPTKVLEKHWPDVPRWRDIKDVTAEDFYRRTGLRTVDLVSGGYPCQPESLAGKRKGKEDDRWLWPEMLKVIKILRPSWVLGENVAGHITLGLETVCIDLESTGYEVRAFVIPACSVGADHKRERVFVIAHLSCERWDCLVENKQDGLAGGGVSLRKLDNSSLKETDTLFSMVRLLPEPISGILRNDDGLSEGMDRLKCLGNAVVPQQVYPILQAIADIETRLRNEDKQLK